MTDKLGYGKEAQIKPGYLSIARKGRSMRSSLWGVLGSQGDLKALDAMGTKTPKSSAAMGEYGGTDTNISTLIVSPESSAHTSARTVPIAHD